MSSRNATGLILVGLCILAMTVCSVNGQGPQIIYPSPPTGKPYATEIQHESNVAMNGWYNAMKLFVKTVQPNKPPVGE